MDEQNTTQATANTKEQNPKQQAIESLKGAQNVLVTVSNDPSVDQLSACIGLTLMLNKLDKHTTAVFSGMVPSTLEFLRPEETLEGNTDSLRDFIISLDKSKADKLRYKVEDNVVKIFITPFRTSITAEDLEFTQGDFNVDVVVALGVDDREHLDQAILEHGRILHDAVVLGISCGQEKLPTDVGTINWHEPTASSLCEMLVSISEAFKTGLLDNQMSTAFLTGIVAETERFSNDKTTPKVMTMSAQLMAAGANQQLIANQLAIVQQSAYEEPSELAPNSNNDIPATPVSNPGELQISHDDTTVENSPEVASQPAVSLDATADNGLAFDVRDNGQVPTNKQSEGTGEEVTSKIEIDERGKMTDLDQDNDNTARRQKVIQPLSEQPERPRTDLSSYVFEPPTNSGTLTANSVPEHEQPELTIDSLAGNQQNTPILSHNNEQPGEQQPVNETKPDQTLEELEKNTVTSPPVADADAARQAINSAMADPSYEPLPTPAQDIGTQEIPIEDAPVEEPATDQQQSLAPPDVPPPLPPYMQPQQPAPSAPESNDGLNLPPPQQQ